MWILNRSQIALYRADLMFGSIAENGSLGEAGLGEAMGEARELSESLPLSLG